MDIATWDLIHLDDEFSDFTLFFVKCTEEKNGNSG